METQKETATLGPIVVGVDGSEHGLRAVRFAVREANRRRCGLRLVHAADHFPPITAGMAPFNGGSILVVGRWVATQAALEVYRLSAGQVEPDVVVQIGLPARVLAEAAADARLVVVGHRELPAVERILTASTTAGVAARVDCPVISVSPSWRPDTTLGWVAVGVDGSPPSGEVLAAAFEAASARGAGLRVVHAWKLPAAYEDLPELNDAEPRWRKSAEGMLGEILAAWRLDYPDVPVEVDLRYERTAEALVNASRSADLLVVGRHGHGGRVAGAFGRVGSIARAVLAHADCPVEITPHRDGPDRDDGDRHAFSSADLLTPTY